jgi:hypothetical protein
LVRRRASPSPQSPEPGITDRSPRADRPVIAALKQPAFVERALDWAERALPAVWADRISRVCLLSALAFLWLGVALGTPLLVIPMAAACVGIWMRRGHRAAASSDLTDPDFF